MSDPNEPIWDDTSSDLDREPLPRVAADKGAERCAFCKRTLNEHSHDSADVCNMFIGESEQLRCAICGFLIDNRFKAEKPSIDFTMAGRSQTRDAELISLRAQLASARTALELAEDVLSRAPFSNQIWPNGMHPHFGIEKIRAALKDLK